ncbi:probable serine racemase [Aplysia californica]|uniref:Probable serine racemase n=1 Tax=Aplysia californica TaxID=6500 RepID=A0ABM1AA87_APLCA|nr:probable serine racemase [Aplysia californica]
MATDNFSVHLISLNDIREAEERISKHIHRTPVFTSRQADEKAGRRLFFKAENLQKTGSFKVRGALNAVLKGKEENAGWNGVVTHSSGNHGQALSFASSIAGIPGYVVVPEMAPQVKKDAIRGYGAHLIECGPKTVDRYETCALLQKEKNLEVIPSSDHVDVIAGQGTIATEFLEEVPDLDAILVSVSGGGMAAGVCVAAKSIKPDIKVYLVTPKGKGLEECLRAGQRLWTGPPQYLDTIADGIKLRHCGFITTQILIDLAEKEVFDMDDDDMIAAMKFSFEKMKLVIEPAAGATVAAAFSDKFQKLDSSLENIGVVLCGGNLDIEQLPW